MIFSPTTGEIGEILQKNAHIIYYLCDLKYAPPSGGQKKKKKKKKNAHGAPLVPMCRLRFISLCALDFLRVGHAYINNPLDVRVVEFPL